MSSADHIQQVMMAVDSSSAAAESWVAASWRRSFLTHGLDPTAPRTQVPVGEMELRRYRAPLERFLAIATPRLDQLFAVVGSSGCGVLVTNADGVVLDQRCSDADARVFREWRLWAGTNWSEAVEGTNGIGTCLSERRPVIVHRTEHFHARNVSMSCIDAPIFDFDGTVLAALDVSSARVDQTEAMNALIAAAVRQAARQIEADNFRAAFPDARILFAANDTLDPTMLFAVDGNDVIVGATRGARKAFGLQATGPIAPRPAADLFRRGDEAKGGDELRGFEKAARAVIARALTRSAGNVSEAARILGIGRATLYRRMKRFGIDSG